MFVLCIEGCHGTGKTELCKRFDAAGFEVMDEAFLDMPSQGIDPQSLLMETTWVCSWFGRILRAAAEGRPETAADRRVVITDRSPFSAVLYSHNGELLRPLIEKQIEELQQYAGVSLFTVNLHVERDVLWRRIKSRLSLEPGRAALREDRRDWMETVCDFYDNFPWDIRVDNTEEDASQRLLRLLELAVKEASLSAPALSDALRAANPGLHAAAGAPSVDIMAAAAEDSDSDASCSDDSRSSTGIEA